jgi:hypothetical protein
MGKHSLTQLPRDLRQKLSGLTRAGTGRPAVAGHDCWALYRRCSQIRDYGPRRAIPSIERPPMVTFAICRLAESFQLASRKIPTTSGIARKFPAHPGASRPSTR